MSERQPQTALGELRLKRVGQDIARPVAHAQPTTDRSTLSGALISPVQSTAERKAAGDRG
jgi:hypothetical protein